MTHGGPKIVAVPQIKSVYKLSPKYRERRLYRFVAAICRGPTTAVLFVASIEVTKELKKLMKLNAISLMYYFLTMGIPAHQWLLKTAKLCIRAARDWIIALFANEIDELYMVENPHFCGAKLVDKIKLMWLICVLFFESIIPNQHSRMYNISFMPPDWELKFATGMLRVDHLTQTVELRRKYWSLHTLESLPIGNQKQVSNFKCRN